MARTLSAAARAKMLEAAQQIITTEGIGACTIDAVARRSGVAKSTIYRHFANADDLAVTAINEMIEIVATPDHGSFRDDLQSIVIAFRGVVRHDTFRQLFVSMLSRAAVDDEYAGVYHQAQEMRHAPLRIAIQRGMARVKSIRTSISSGRCTSSRVRSSPNAWSSSASCPIATSRSSST